MRMRSFILGTTFALASGLSAVAQPVPPNDEARIVALGDQLNRTTDPAARLALADQTLALLVQPTRRRGAILCMRYESLERLERKAEARRAFDQCRVLLPDDPNVLLAAAYYDMGENRPVEAAGNYIRVAAIEPRLMGQVAAPTIEGLIRQLGFAQRNQLSSQLIEALVSAGYGTDDPGAFSALVASVVLTRADAGKPREAIPLLPSILDPQMGLALLIDRRLEPIWPKVENWAGNAFGTQREAFLASSQARFTATNSLDSVRPYAGALDKTGRRAEAIELLKTWVAAPALDEGDRWERAMATVRLAGMLSEQGRRDESIGYLRAALQRTSADRQAKANIVPNFVTHLLLSGNFTSALDVLAQHAPKTEEVEAPAAIGYFVALKACALAGSGRAGEAIQAASEVRNDFAINRRAVEIVTSCMGTVAQQTAGWISSVEDVDTRSTALLAFARARYRADQKSPLDSISEVAMRRVIADPAAQRAYVQFARPVPVRYQAALNGFNTVAGRTTASE